MRINYPCILIVDEICGVGETISMVKIKVEELGASAIKSAVFHPEYVAALEQQGLKPDPSLLIPATPFALAKE